MQGYLITVEGPDGAGKTTVLNEIIKRISPKLKYPYLVTREPGGSQISENIRKIILDPHNNEMDATTEALLYAASRSQHVHEVLLPALKKGKIIFSDRFVDSSLAYQGMGRKLGIDEVKLINDFATEHLEPQLTLFLDIKPEDGLARIKKERPDQEDRLEQEKLSFHEQVYQGYQEVLKKYPARMHRIDANQKLDDVVQNSIEVIQNNLPEIFK
ncbi:dTMP kinase [Lactobacillus sp. PV037]|uniref:dTMP kinase n=1 Tax=unclassified Lactobacillus TaxID=2620435 RepID=UPI00223E8F65|nr:MULTISPECIES: dTMP kinase [unclassified Lactobacillus]QNQ81884.1 dTMP kinase [Lactobacillus sp. PV012]QNQ84078.1 dTMP kinase [Lactobacillus sp. PV037]